MYLKHVLSVSIVVLFMFLAWSSGPAYVVPCGDPKNLQAEPIQGSPNQTTDLIIRVLDKETKELIPGIYINFNFDLKVCNKIENCSECYMSNRVLQVKSDVTNSLGLIETSVSWPAKDAKDKVVVNFTAIDDGHNYSSQHSTILIAQNIPSVPYTIYMLKNESL